MNSVILGKVKNGKQITFVKYFRKTFFIVTINQNKTRTKGDSTACVDKCDGLLESPLVEYVQRCSSGQGEETSERGGRVQITRVLLVRSLLVLRH